MKQSPRELEPLAPRPPVGTALGSVPMARRARSADLVPGPSRPTATLGTPGLTAAQTWVER